MKRRRKREELLEFDMAQIEVGDVADKNPSNFEDPLPFVRSPYCTASRVVDLKLMEDEQTSFA